jgi:thiol:disulfide interchange protein DsbD
VRTLLALIAAAALAQAPARAAPVRTDNVEAELVSSRAAVAPGERFTAALREKIRAGWHTYWRNPGDSGAPSEIAWKLPDGFAAGPLQFPLPTPIRVGPLVNYGYEGEVLLPVEVTAPASLKPGPVDLPAHASWLVCADICIPEEVDLSLHIDGAAAGRDDPVWAPRIAAALAAVPKPAGLNAVLSPMNGRFQLTASGGPLAGAAIRNPYFFPFAGDAVDHAAKQPASFEQNGVALTLSPSAIGNIGKGPLAGVLAFETKDGGAWVRRGVEIEAKLGPPPPASPAPRAAGGIGLAAAIGFAFLGGLILNIMPCVFPVLSIKALSLARGSDAAEARRHGLFFLVGVLASFLALAGGLIALQAAGAAVGWGFQLQEPLVVGGLALLFFAIGLNLIGAFEIGGGLQNLGGGLAARGGEAGAFFTGALAVVAATPCTAPFMGAALGFAATQPPAQSLVVFASLGLGFAAPFTALSLVPALRAWMPKPGPWMARFKEFLAFPMFAAAAWLVWVLTQQAGAMGALAAMAAFIAVGFLVWAQRAFRAPAARWGSAALALLLLGAAGWSLRPAPANAARAEPASLPLSGEAWSPQREAALRAAGRPVFVNFTAAWCVTCQVNERVALRAPEVARAFAAAHAAYLEADWTQRDAVIAKTLAAHGRAGVPLYLLYPSGDAPARVLPQILTPGIVLDALRSVQGPSPGG